jgi:hypothetical protein
LPPFSSRDSAAGEWPDCRKARRARRGPGWRFHSYADKRFHQAVANRAYDGVDGRVQFKEGVVPRDRDHHLDRGADEPPDPSKPDALYVQLSVQRSPRTWWERLRARLGARFFEVETRLGSPPDD